MMNDLLTLLLARDQILEEVDGDLLVRRKIYASVDREEVVALSLAGVLCAKLLG